MSFFRSIGSVIGVAAFGSVYSNRLHHNLVVAGPAAAAKAGAYANAIHTLFLVVVPVAAAAFVLSLFLKEVPLRSTSAETNPGATLGITQSVTSGDELGRALSRLLRKENVAEAYRRLAATAGLPLTPGATWLLARIAAVRAGVEHRTWPTQPGSRLLSWRTELETAGYLQAGEPIRLTQTGADAGDRLFAARRSHIRQRVADWSPEQHAQLAALINSLADGLQGIEPEREVTSAAP